MKLVDLIEVFTPDYGVNLEYNKMKESPHGIPFVARGMDNNGVVGLVERIEGIDPNPSMTISLAASGSVMECFLQEHEYYSGRDLYCLKVNKGIELSREEMLYYCMILRANKYRYSFGRQANRTIASIKIPSPSEIPDYVREVSIASPSKGRVIKKKINLSDREWKTFPLKDVFCVKGTDTTSIDYLLDQGKGEFPYVTTQSANNGVEGLFNCKTEEGNVICVDSAVVGFSSYQKKSFSASDHVEKLKLKGRQLNTYIAMFLVTMLNREQFRYSYGRKRSHERISAEKIRLPVNKSGNPDWKFMENFIKSLPGSNDL